ncbi:diguanylate cyclase [bacterium]|nr:diguanylate cyclase [bacterium]
MESIELLNRFIETNEYKRTMELFAKKFGGVPVSIIANDGRILGKPEKEQSFCQMIKASNDGQPACSTTFSSIFEQATTKEQPIVFTCHAGFLGYAVPLFMKRELLGTLYSCGLTDLNKDLHSYTEIATKFHFDPQSFSYAISQANRVTVSSLETDIELISSLLNNSIALIREKIFGLTKEQETDVITRFYDLFEKSKQLLLTLEPAKLYSLVVSLASKAMNAEICSLMLFDQKKEELTIKAGVGLDKRVMEEAKFKKGVGIVGYVAQTGKPLLVGDITNDPRFNIKKSSPKYYTKSLISAPLKVGEEVFGIINMNNKASRAPFNETDLKLLSIICGHAAIAIKNSKVSWSEEKETLAKELLSNQEEKEKVAIEKEELLEKKVDFEAALKEKEDALRIKMEFLTKEKLDEEKKKFSEAINQLEKERDDLKKKIAESEELIHKKEDLEKRLEEAIKEKEELEAQTEELGVLYSISSETPKMSKPKEILSWILDKIQPFFNYHASAYLYLDGERLIGEIRQACFVNEDCLKSIENKMTVGWKKYNPEGLERAPEFFTEKKEAESGLFWVGLKEFQTDLAFPIVHGEKTTGLISVYSFNKEPFPPLQRRLLRIISHQISETLERVALFVKITELAEKDELTKTYNYRYLEDFLSREFAYATSYKKPISLIMLDFDRLKYVNDTFGHQDGNKLIVTISNIIKKTMDGKGLIARFGGDEFAVVLPETDQNAAFQFAEKIRANIANHPMSFGGKPHQATASLGVSGYPNQGIDNEKDIFAKADKCLYAAKEAGRNKVILYKP